MRPDDSAIYGKRKKKNKSENRKAINTSKHELHVEIQLGRYFFKLSTLGQILKMKKYIQHVACIVI